MLDAQNAASYLGLPQEDIAALRPGNLVPVDRAEEIALEMEHRICAIEGDIGGAPALHQAVATLRRIARSQHDRFVEIQRAGSLEEIFGWAFE